MKFATKPRWHYPPHLRHVVTLPSEIKNSNFLQILKKKQTNCILIAFTFVIHPQILIFLVFKIANLSPYWLQIKLLCHCSFTYLLLRSVCGIGNSSPQTSLQCLSTINMLLKDEDKILGCTAKRLTDEFPGQSMVLVSVWKSCVTRAQLTRSQAVADRAVLALKKTLRFFFRSSRSLPLTLFCRSSGEVTENTFRP